MNSSFQKRDLDVPVAGDDSRADVAANRRVRAHHLLVLDLDVVHVARQDELTCMARECQSAARLGHVITCFCLKALKQS